MYGGAVKGNKQLRHGPLPRLAHNNAGSNCTATVERQSSHLCLSCSCEIYSLRLELSSLGKHRKLHLLDNGVD